MAQPPHPPPPTRRRILSKQGMECTPVFHNMFPQSHLKIYKQSPEEEEERKECTGALNICPTQAYEQKWMKVREKKGGGGSEARSMLKDKLLRSWRSHSKPGNHATLIPNFKHLHPPAEHPGAASASPLPSRCIAFSLFFSTDRDRMEKIWRLGLCRRAEGGDGEDAGLGRKV